VLYRNVKASFEKQRDLAGGAFESGVWIDYDHDYDLDLVLLGEKSRLLRNEGAAGFSDRTADFPFVAGQAVSGVATRLIADSKAFDLVVAYKDRSPVLYLDRSRGRYEPQVLDGLPPGARPLVSFDVDGDGWLDLAAATSSGLEALLNRGGRLEPKSLGVPDTGGFIFADLENRGAGDIVAASGIYRNFGQAAFGPAIKRAEHPEAAAWAEADFNRDGRADLAAVASDGGLYLLLNRTATKHQWFEVTLLGVKNTKLAPGSEVEVKAGACYQKKVCQGVPLLFGLRTYQHIDTVRVTWPNGMIQNETSRMSTLKSRSTMIPSPAPHSGRPGQTDCTCVVRGPDSTFRRRVHGVSQFSPSGLS